MTTLVITEKNLIKTEKSSCDILNKKVHLYVEGSFSKKDLKIAIKNFLGSFPIKVNSIPYIDRKKKSSRSSKGVVKGSARKFIILISDIEAAKEKFKIS